MFDKKKYEIEYRNRNRDKFREYWREWRRKHKNKSKEYYQKNKEMINEKCKLYQRRTYLKVNGIRIRVKKREFKGYCELCNYKIEHNPHWNHWNDNKPELGIWVCWHCHRICAHGMRWTEVLVGCSIHWRLLWLCIGRAFLPSRPRRLLLRQELGFWLYIRRCCMQLRVSR